MIAPQKKQLTPGMTAPSTTESSEDALQRTFLALFRKIMQLRFHLETFLRLSHPVDTPSYLLSAFAAFPAPRPP